MNWETVIGLETHVELATKSKIFCACTTAFGGAPNTHCCPVCTGMPGALPVLNGKVVEYAVRAALALGCTVTRHSRFDRKNYFYPDLPKAYQISQLYLPIGRDGAVEAGGRVVQETRRWDENKDASYPMRSKEDAQDYRYFPEPDLPPLELSEAYIQALRASQPELATAKRARYQAAWGLGPYDAEMLTSQKALARFFEETVALGSEPKQAANWLMGPVLAQLSAHGLEARDMALTPPTLARLIQLVKEGRLNRNTAVKVCEAVFETDGDVDAYVAAHGLAQVSDAGLVAQVVEQVLSANEKSVADYCSGKEKAFGFLVGQVMRQLKGQAAPAVVRQVLLEQLAEQ